MMMANVSTRSRTPLLESGLSLLMIDKKDLNPKNPMYPDMATMIKVAMIKETIKVMRSALGIGLFLNPATRPNISTIKTMTRRISKIEHSFMTSSAPVDEPAAGNYSGNDHKGTKHDDAKSDEAN